MKRKLLFIINPNSGTSSKKELPNLIRSQINEDLFDYEICITQRPGHAVELARNAVLSTIDIVAVAGGDGSINEVTRGLQHSNTAMALLPLGSGNGLARHLSVPLELTEALKLIQYGKEKWCDTFTVSGHTGIGTFGLGFDAHIAHLFAQSNTRGYSTYVKLVLKEFSRFKGISLKMKFDGEDYTGSPFLFTVANSSQFGNNAVIAPMADSSDGWLDLAFVRKFPLWSAPSLIYRLTHNSLNKSKFYSHARCKEIYVENKKVMRAHIDGEPVEISGDFRIQVIPSSIKIIVPSR
jgi:diacylglycerol kinase (ATP)